MIERISIVGGGTAGWMAAAYLRRTTGRAVTLIESADISTIGVGEATIPALIDFIRCLGVDEDVFMRHCSATYKLGIQFVNWVEPQHEYWHPFGLCGGAIDGIDLFHFWLKSQQSGQRDEPYSTYSLQMLLAQNGRAPRLPDSEPVVANYAFHLDAGSLADFLKQLALEWGVEHIVDSVAQVQCDEQGTIKSLLGSSGRSHTADFFIDCTGFRALLIGDALGVSHLDWSDMLLCDRALVLRQPRDPQMPPYTRSTGASAGWIWQIPLSDRVGLGYVYSSAHISDDSAAEELMAYANADADRGQMRRLNMKVGRQTEFWKNNCLAIGLSAGFIEPLESTGIFLIQRGLEEFVECFPATPESTPLAEVYNNRLAAVFDETRDFVLLHYILSRRADSPFWRDSRSVPLPPSLERRLALYDQTGMIAEHPRNPAFRETNFYYIYTGADRLPQTPSGRVEFSNFPSVLQLMQRIREGNQQISGRLPSHASLMEVLHGP